MNLAHYNRCKSVVVLGMHRSGTSMIAGILKKLGVNIGRDVTPDSMNPLGHFENRKFVELNDRILKAAGGSWHKPPEEGRLLALKQAFSKDIRSLIQLQKSQIWGWKDPRTAVTIELYLPYLENPHFLVCHRDVLAIAKSLNKRDKMRIGDGMNLATAYYRRVDSFFKKHVELKKLDLFYTNVVSNPEEWLEKLTDFLDISVQSQQYYEALGFILPEEKKGRSYINYLIRSGVKYPWKVPIFLIRKFL